MNKTLYERLLNNRFIPTTSTCKIVASIFGINLQCPICKTYCRTMRSYGPNDRPNAQCRICGSLERYRWLYLWLEAKTNLFHKQVSILDIAPNSSLENLFRKASNINYTTSNINNDEMKVDIVADLTQFPQNDSNYDYIILLEVLEHITDDKKALSECFRILKPNGKCVITVPINTDKWETIMDPELSSDERLKIYGQSDHIRIYGNDFIELLQSLNFKNVIRLAPKDILTESDMRKYSIKNKYRFHDYETCNDLFICEK